MTQDEMMGALLREAAATKKGEVKAKLLLDETQVAKAKEQRFGLSARILTGKDIKVKVINNPLARYNADYNTATRVLRLNEAHPAKVANPVEELIYDRGKLYHEIAHARYTAEQTLRETLGPKSKNRDLFLTVSGLLEDGRVERKLVEDFKGTAPYLDSLLAVSTNTQSMDILNGLALRVRKGHWRNEKEAAFWQRFEKQIDEAVKADHTNGPVQVGFDIVEALDLPKQPQSQPMEPDPEGKGKIEGDGKAGEKSESKARERPESEPDDTESKSGNGKSKQPPTPKEYVEKALEMAAGEQQSEWDGIVEQVLSDPVQEMASPSESAVKDQLTVLFKNVLTESARTREYTSREGILNTQSLHNILLPNKRIFKTKTEGKGKPTIALLLDASGSMSAKMATLNPAARALNGALREAGIETKVIVFGMENYENGGEVVEMPTIPTYGIAAYGGTPTTEALQVANEWFEESGATKPLAIIITDGAPNNLIGFHEQKAKTNQLNGTVLGVQITDENSKSFEKYYKNTQPAYFDLYKTQFDISTEISSINISGLPDLLQPLLSDYINS